MKKIHPKKFLLWLGEQLEIWKEEEIITEEQINKIKGKYNFFEVEQKGIPSKLIVSISTIGSLLIGSGIILFIASNWEFIPKLSKIGIIFGMVFIVNHLGYYLRYTKANYPKIGSAILFLGSILFGGGIWLIAQVYNITSRYHNGILFWALGIIPIAWLLGLETILSISSGLLSFWMVWKCTDFNVPNFPYLLLMVILILPLCYKEKAKVALLLSLTGLSVWFGLGPCAAYLNKTEFLMTICYLPLGIFIYSVGLLHSSIPKISSYQLFYKLQGSIILFLSIYVLSFKDSSQKVIMLLQKPLPILIPFFYILITVLFFSFGVMLYAFLLYRHKNSSFSKVMNYEFFILCLFLFFLISIFTLKNIVFYGIFSNLILLIFSVGFIFGGYCYNKQPAFVNLGFIFFSIHFTTRYIDLGWKYLSRSVFFTIAGLLLLLGATFMERKRKKLIEEIKVSR